MEDEEEHPKEFPDVNHKLSAPKKLSAFERDRQAAEAKRQRAEEENAAALRAFQDSFAEDEDAEEGDAFAQMSAGRGGPPAGPRGGSGLGSRGRYGMPPGPPRNGPGSLDPGGDVLPPPPSMKRRRALDELREAQEARREQELLASEQTADSTEQKEDERMDDAPRPTVQLSSLPPSMSADEVKIMLRDHVNVQSVRFQPPVGPGSDVKRSMSAIATLSSDTPAAKIDSAVGSLKDKYLGCGFYLTISRHLSSAALHPSMGPQNPLASSRPFGAEKPRDTQDRHSLRHAPPPRDLRGFAPPDSYDSLSSRSYGQQPESDQIAVRPPADMATTRAVHLMAEHLLMEPDPERALEIEAMLMSLPEVQRDERFAFLYDSKSPAGVYYRYLLWGPDDHDEAIQETKRNTRAPERIHKDVDIDWMPPYELTPFLDLKSLSQVVTDLDYVSSDEESDDEGGERRFNNGQTADSALPSKEKDYLTPLQYARLIHLLARLPTSNGRLRKGDVARITNFAITHAGQGAEEIVDALLLNVKRPLSYTLAAKYEDPESSPESEDAYEPDEDLPRLTAADKPPPTKETKRDDDPSNAKLIALYVISDILSASSTAGARNAWKYRQLVEAGFKAQRTFEHLGKLDRELGWGRMKAEQWKRKVGVVFGIWEGWSVFPGEVQEELKRSFFEPPLSAEERAAGEAMARAEAEADERRRRDQEEEARTIAQRDERTVQEEKWAGRFKRVDQRAADSPPTGGGPSDSADAQRDARSRDAGVGDHAGIGSSADSNSKPNQPLRGGIGFSAPSSGSDNKPPPSGPRRRMRAEDMFADDED